MGGCDPPGKKFPCEFDSRPSPKTNSSVKITCNYDGATFKGNPSFILGLGTIIRVKRGPTREAAIPLKEGRELSNNYAEYAACVDILKALLDTEGAEIHITGDSKLLTNQMTGGWEIKNGVYRPLAFEALELIKQIKEKNKINFLWVPRESNTAADALSKKALKLNAPEIIFY